MKRLLGILLVAGTAAAQAPAPRTIEPGMTRAQVEARLGPPVASRSAGASTFLFYQNGCERKCGMHDLVVLDSDRVTDAIFRSADRRYTGASSSPAAVTAAAGAPGIRSPSMESGARPRKLGAASATVPAHSDIQIPTIPKSGTAPAKTPPSDRARQADSLKRARAAKKPEV